jgi:hypothetical protein
MPSPVCAPPPHGWLNRAIEWRARGRTPRSTPRSSRASPNRWLCAEHADWSSREARQRLIDQLAANIAAFNDGEWRNRFV